MNERRRLSVTIKGPEPQMLEAIAELLRKAGYQVFEPGTYRYTVSVRTKGVVNALRNVHDTQIADLARSWKFARLEQARREAEPDN